MSSKNTLVFKTLYDPLVHKGIPATLDVVLIHGLNGDYLKTWLHSATGVCWPRDLLPAVLPSARVLSFTYSADIYGNTSVTGIRGNANALLARLRDRRERADGRPIVFVAHSLGGIILKQALYLSQHDRRFHGLLDATRGLIFYGTPHFGADRSRWLSMAKSFAPLLPRRFAGMRKAKASNLVDALARSSLEISNICEDFRFLARRFVLVSFYETEVWPGTTSAPIVDMMSALMHLDNEERVPLEANHMDLCRFMGPEDAGFQLTCRYIAQAALGLGHGRGDRWGILVSGDAQSMYIPKCK
ncbi:Alpha/Beta hydrolase protein [Chaetomium strumarium]|uniref:Alpha/Beta hydrolase protein n=1 Tax=Chaetomium strumarium TaxID=1170767 RepID=A0AAJ0M1W5_9PEZI|nr:Alpha/Beta hydrolase protein [Chaetomium strumarium]